MTPRTQITRVVLENYKSIAHCDVSLRPLSFLVGPNGAGKSNFLDALQFVKDVLLNGFQTSIANRGGIEELLCHAPGAVTRGQSRRLAIGLDLQLTEKATAHFSFTLHALSPGGYRVEREECKVYQSVAGDTPVFYQIENGKLQTSTKDAPLPVMIPDRLYLQSASGQVPFQPVYQALTRMRTYHIDPAALRTPRAFASTDDLAEDGSNLASVLWQLARTNRPLFDRIRRYLEAILPGLHGIEVQQVSSFLVPFFRIASADGKQTTDFPIASMSDGTLRALAILVALLQGASSTNGGGSLLLLEEPEMALHPGATRVLLDAMREASERMQVLVTTHSADLLDQKEIGDEEILAVVSEDGITRIGSVNEAARSAIHDHLFTAGELLRTGALTPANA